MKTPARLFGILALALSAATPCRGVVAVTWLAEPIVLWSQLFARYEPLDLNADGFTDFVFASGVASVGARSEGDNQYLIWPSGGPNIGGDIEPLLAAFEIGPNSGDDSWIDWFGDGVGYDNLITCLNSGGPVCVGRFAGQRAYMGVAFEIDAAIHYGWIDLLVAPDNPYAEIYGWGYETEPGVGILAGAGMIPEPATSALLAVGGLLLALRRKWK